jgi:protease secretion system outer membrane protein
MKSGLLGLVCFLSPAYACAGSFQQAYEAALSNDASYRSARAEFASTQQNLPMARAALLPTVSLSMAESKIDGSRQIDNPLGAPTTTTLDYRAPVQSLSLRTPIFNLEAVRKVTLAQAQINYAASVFEIRKAELVDRLGTAWLEEFMAGQAALAAQAQVEAARAQLDQARRRLQLGEGTKPDLSDADAALDIASALEREAQNNLEVARISVRQITGAATGSPWTPDHKLNTKRLLQDASQSAETLTRLLSTADASNPNIASRRAAVAITQATVARNSAGHYPRLDFVASATRSRNESLSTLNQSANQRSVGLQLNVPLYSGGYVNASIAQALADQTKAEADLAAEQQTVAKDVTKLHFSVASGASKIQAYQKAFDAAGLAVEGARKAQRAGFGLQSEVLVAEQKVHQKRFELVQAVASYLLSRLRLGARTDNAVEQAVGQLDQTLQSLGAATP